MNPLSLRVLLASDGSEPVLHACELILPLLPNDVHVRILTVLSFDAYPWSLVGGLPPADEETGKAAVLDAVEDATRDARLLFEKVGIHVEVAHRYGHPPDEILKEVDEWEPQLLVMGRRRVRGIERLLGSVSEHVVRHAAVPTLLVP